MFELMGLASIIPSDPFAPPEVVPDQPPALLPGGLALEEADRSWKADLAFIGLTLLVVGAAAVLENPLRGVVIFRRGAPRAARSDAGGV
jgi:hypothetical protein